jgi:hypothetical protein
VLYYMRVMWDSKKIIHQNMVKDSLFLVDIPV